jgi:hypothetical protein
MITRNRDIETEEDEITLAEVNEFVRTEWKWLLLAAFFGLIAAAVILLIIPKKNISKTQIQLSISASTTSIANTFKDVQNFSLKIQEDCGLLPSTPRLTKNHILIKPTPNKPATISVVAQIYLPLDSKKCVQSIADHFYYLNQAELEKLSEPLDNKILSANKNILEINKLIAQSDRDTTGNSILIKAILLQPLLLYQDQILNTQEVIKKLKSSPFAMGSIEDQHQPFSKTIVILVIGALAGLVIGAGIRFTIRYFSRQISQK